jgi:Mg2+/Co2+ transporter CorC
VGTTASHTPRTLHACSASLSLRTLLRPAVFVPESKGLNELLRD